MSMSMPAPGMMPAANLSDDQRPLIMHVTVAMICLSAIAVILRFSSRLLTKSPFLWDDWLVLAALPFAWAAAAIDIYGT